MIKGVNRKVIEVNQPDSLYFERAVLYLRPEVTDAGLQAAAAESEQVLSGLPGRSRNEKKFWTAFLLGMLVSGSLFGLMLWIFPMKIFLNP